MKKRLLLLLAGCIILHWYIKSALMHDKSTTTFSESHNQLDSPTEDKAITDKT